MKRQKDNWFSRFFPWKRPSSDTPATVRPSPTPKPIVASAPESSVAKALPVSSGTSNTPPTSTDAPLIAILAEISVFGGSQETAKAAQLLFGVVETIKSNPVVATTTASSATIVQSTGKAEQEKDVKSLWPLTDKFVAAVDSLFPPIEWEQNGGVTESCRNVVSPDFGQFGAISLSATIAQSANVYNWETKAISAPFALGNQQGSLPTLSQAKEAVVKTWKSQVRGLALLHLVKKKLVTR